MSDYFDELVNQLRDHHLSIDLPFIHGLLTGYATTPKSDLAKLWQEISGKHPLPEPLQDEVINVMGFLSEDLSTDEFHALFQTDNSDEPERWINGYFKAVEIHEEQWREENECHPKAGAALVILHSLVNDELRQELEIVQPGQRELREQPEIVTDLAHTIYQLFHGDLDDTFSLDDRFDPPTYELTPLPDYSEEALVGMDENMLFALITNNDDRLPLEVVHACASRAETMVPLLRQHLENDANWGNEVSDGDWWGLLHSIFILGLIPGAASAKALLEGFRRITFDSNNNLSDWVSGYWPALCSNKTEHTTGSMRQIAEDRELDWHPRSHSVQCVMADAGERESARLEDTLDWIAALCLARRSQRTGTGSVRSGRLGTSGNLCAGTTQDRSQ